MGVPVNPKMSGFRKWAEIHEPAKIDEIGTGANDSDTVAAADIDQDKKHRTSNRIVHGSFPARVSSDRYSRG